MTITWASQRALNAALLASLLGVLIACAVAMFDRRRPSEVGAFDTAPAAVPCLARWSEWSGDRIGLATVAVATLSGALFIGWIWGLVAAIVCVALRFTGRVRLFGAAGLVIVVAAQLIVVTVVLRERPYPNAGWPVRFEWLHPWTLLGVILLASATLFARDAASPGPVPGSAPEATPDE